MKKEKFEWVAIIKKGQQGKKGQKNTDTVQIITRRSLNIHRYIDNI